MEFEPPWVDVPDIRLPEIKPLDLGMNHTGQSDPIRSRYGGRSSFGAWTSIGAHWSEGTSIGRSSHVHGLNVGLGPSASGGLIMQSDGHSLFLHEDRRQWRFEVDGTTINVPKTGTFRNRLEWSCDLANGHWTLDANGVRWLDHARLRAGGPHTTFNYSGTSATSGFSVGAQASLGVPMISAATALLALGVTGALVAAAAVYVGTCIVIRRMQAVAAGGAGPASGPGRSLAIAVAAAGLTLLTAYVLAHMPQSAGWSHALVATPKAALVTLLAVLVSPLVLDRLLG